MAASTLLPIEEARTTVLAATRPLAAETLTLDTRALGRVLAEDVVAAVDVPAFDGSAMDGFAVRAADVRGASDAAPAQLALVGEARAGAPTAAVLGPGEAIAISTGAMVPAGADAVVRVEDTRAHDGHVEILRAVPAGLDVRRAGDDIRAGRTVLVAGTTLGPAELGVLASLGWDRIACARRPRVRVLATGDELVRPGEPLSPGGVRDSNALSLPSLALTTGAELAGVAHVGDDADATREAIAAALDADVSVICGGVSVGVHDHVRPALAELGVEQAFWGVAL
jgi:molybdopterin molybdotransferase